MSDSFNFNFNTFNDKKIIISIALGCILSLAGCGGNYTEQVSKVVGQTKYLAPSPENERAQGFEYINLNNQGILEFKLIEKIYAPEYQAPIIQNSKVEGIKANPVGTIFATFFTLGLYPVIETKDAFQLTTGRKLNETLLNEQPDLTQQRKTGNYAWLTKPLDSASLSVTGLAESIPIKYAHNNSQVYYLDISSALLEWALKNNSDPQITIECHNCISNGKENIPTKKTLSFTTPEIWKLDAKYRKSFDVIWAADDNLNNFNVFSNPRTGLNTDNSWNNILSGINSKISNKLQDQIKLPSELVRARNDLLKSAPASEITISRDEFESTLEFKQRLTRLENIQKQKIIDHNKKVDALEMKISNFQSQAPTSLTKPQRQSIINSTIQQIAGDPIIRNVKYDADLKRLIVQVSGASQSNRKDLISLVSTSEVMAADAKKIKENFKATRVYLGFNLNDNKLIPQGGHIYDGQSIFKLQNLDELVIPELHTAKIIINEKTNLPLNLKIDPDKSKFSPNINLSKDPEIAKLHERLDSLRNELIEKQQISDKDIINNEIKSLESKLKTINEGSFNDDLKDLFSKPSSTTVNNNISAIVVGIADYYELPKVIFADRSADAFATLLNKQFGVPDKNILLIKNEQATGFRLIERIRKAAERSTEGQKLIFYFAGHGAPSRDGKNPILIPFDASGTIMDEKAFRLNEIYKILLQSKAKQIWVVLDSCFSGLTDQNEMIFKDIAPIMPKISELAFQNDKRLIVLAGSGPNDFAHAFRNKGHRLFTYHLIKEISNSKGLYKIRYPNLVDTVMNDSFRLVPSFEQKPMWMGGEFNLTPAP